MQSKEYDGESSEIGLKMPTREHADIARYSFMGILVPVVEEDSIEECWYLFQEIDSRSFSFPLLYWGVIS